MYWLFFWPPGWSVHWECLFLLNTEEGEAEEIWGVESLGANLRWMSGGIERVENVCGNLAGMACSWALSVLLSMGMGHSVEVEEGISMRWSIGSIRGMRCGREGRLKLIFHCSTKGNPENWVWGNGESRIGLWTVNLHTWSSSRSGLWSFILTLSRRLMLLLGLFGE